MTFGPYIATLRTLTPKQLAAEVAARLRAFNDAEERLEAYAVIEEARQKWRLAVRESAKRRECAR